MPSIFAPSRLVPGLALVLGLAWGGSLYAGPPKFDPMRAPLPQTGPAAVSVAASSITILQVDSDEGRHYRLWVAAIGKPPASGYPMMILLDGHAAIQTLIDTRDSAPLPGPILLVAVGTPGPAYFDVEQRAYDYTPDLADGQPIFDPRVPQRRAGGAEAFLATLLGPVQQALSSRWPLDPLHRGLWGHSYGGLFTLYTLLRHGDAFQFYAPTSPSLWWHAPLPQNLAERFDRHQPGASACVRLSNGSAEGRPGHHGSRPDAVAPDQPSPPLFSAADLVQQLEPVFGQRLQWQTYPGLSHGETFPASLGPAIRSFSAWSHGAASCGFDAIKR